MIYFLLFFVDTIFTITGQRAYDFIGKAVKNGGEFALTGFRANIIRVAAMLYEI